MACITPWIIRGCCPRPRTPSSARPETGVEPTPTEFQPDPQAPMRICPQGAPRHALALAKPVPCPDEPQHHQPRQRHTVPTQAHRLPAQRPAEYAPAQRISAQTGNGTGISQQDTTGDDPAGVSNTTGKHTKAKPPGQHAQPQDLQGQHLANQIGRQQQARALPTALETLTWAGHDPE